MTANRTLSTTAAARRRPGRYRAVLVAVHRYVGLTIVVFLTMAGLTGALLAFNPQLDAWLNPALFRVAPPAPDTPPLDAFTLHERMAASLAAHGVPEPPRRVDLSPRPAGTREALSVWAGADGAERQYFIHPYSGAVLGSRAWGDLTEGRVNLMPFIYRLHYSLALGDVGGWLMGVVALLWTLDCFVGFWLTLPRPRSAAAAAADGRSWLARWRPSWLVRAASLFGAVFSFHRAAGLWLWALLFVFAWSSVGFNLNPVFQPVMRALGASAGGKAPEPPGLAAPRTQPALDWRAAHATGRRLLAEAAAAQNLRIVGEERLSYTPATGMYEFRARSAEDAVWAGFEVTFDGDTGTTFAVRTPRGLTPADRASEWLFALHVGAVGGLAYRVVISVVGLVVVGLGVTGVAIWWRKRAARTRRA